ncbi:cytochrome P450 [Mytilinidion resinicola]|uniref:Cytochrome P450 n=1 Tax=Mytilinidion resinicola TaxID=574789 RepID=A0A6A6YR36_9PEZI|nr:cytochrome P450 [Mytilinidion resinicola]KAF2811372.1 cytochrome P450 [Mytilinidion resinicola]
MSSANFIGTDNHYQPFAGSVLGRTFANTRFPITITITITLILPLLIRYTIARLEYYHQRRHISPTQLPPTYPCFIPYIGHLLSLLISGPTFLQRATTHAGHLTSTRLTLLTTPLYLFQDPATVRALWKSPALSSPLSSYVYVLGRIFGMRSAALAAYRADDSGPFLKPYSGSAVLAKDRIDYITHADLLRELTGVGLGPLTSRTVRGVLSRVGEAEAELYGGWVEKADLFKLLRGVVGTSIMEALAGPALLELNPGFVEDFWEFDKSVPWFGHGIPAFLMPRAVRRRERLKGMLKRWYGYARERFEEGMVGEDGDGDPAWGSELMRRRQERLREVAGQDEDSMAASDLGLVWASVANIVPSTLMATFHLFAQPGLLDCVRAAIAQGNCRVEGSGFDLKALMQIPLLASIYAETLRLYTNSYFATRSPHSATSLGRWMLPKDAIAMVNSRVSHMDSGVWNAAHPSYPAQTFWADRFVNAEGEFSAEGFEGSWIPYGGGHAICPGRFLAKTVIILVIALMAERFDVEILNKSVDMDMGKLGLGVLRPNKAIGFRIRRRYDGRGQVEK